MGYTVDQWAREVSRDQILVGLLELYSSIGGEPFTESLDKERHGQIDVLQDHSDCRANDGLKKGGDLKMGTLMRGSLQQSDRYVGLIKVDDSRDGEKYLDLRESYI